MPNSDAPRYRIRGIPAPLIERMWPFAEPYVKRALDHASGEIDANNLREWCIERDVQLWLVSAADRVVGAATTEIVIYPHKKHCRVITIAGSGFAEWVGDMDATLATWAQAQGCDALEAHVRRGFVQRLAPLGYKHLHSVVVKELPRIMTQQEGVQDGQEEPGRRPNADDSTES